MHTIFSYLLSVITVICSLLTDKQTANGNVSIYLVIRLVFTIFVTEIEYEQHEKSL